MSASQDHDHEQQQRVVDATDGLRRRPYTRLWFRAQAPREQDDPLFDNRLVSFDLTSVSGSGRPIFATVHAISPEQFSLDHED